MDLRHNKKLFEVGTRVAVVCLFALGCYLWGRSSEQAKADATTRDVERVMLEGEYKKLYGALKTHFPDEFTAERDGLVRLTQAKAGRNDFAVFLRMSSDQLEIRHVEDFAAAGGPALAKFRVAEIAEKEALLRRSAEYCGSSLADDLTPTDGLRNAESIPVETGEMNYTMVMAMADGMKAKIHRVAPSPEAYAALRKAMARQGMTPGDISDVNRSVWPSGRSAEKMCVLDLRTLKAINSLPPEQADLFTVVAFRNNTNATIARTGRPGT